MLIFTIHLGPYAITIYNMYVILFCTKLHINYEITTYLTMFKENYYKILAYFVKDTCMTKYFLIGTIEYKNLEWMFLLCVELLFVTEILLRWTALVSHDFNYFLRENNIEKVIEQTCSAKKKDIVFSDRVHIWNKYVTKETIEIHQNSKKCNF